MINQGHLLFDVINRGKGKFEYQKNVILASFSSLIQFHNVFSDAFSGVWRSSPTKKHFSAMRKWLSNGPEINDSYSVKDKTKFAVHQNENQKLQGIFFFLFLVIVY